MSRSLVGHIVRGRKRATYNHSDSYPSHLGEKIVQFIKSLSPEQIDTMIQNLNSSKYSCAQYRRRNFRHVLIILTKFSRVVSKPPKTYCNVAEEGTRIDERVPPSEELQTRYSAAGFADLGVSSQSSNDWYCLLRNVQGADALPYILDGTLSHLTDNVDFEEDELFCEWAYFIDREQKVLTVKGRTGVAEKSFDQLSEEWMLSLQEA